MLKSMTGFGQTSLSLGPLSISIEVKSLNSKFFDLNLRLPKRYAEKELEVRNLLTDKLERGKVSFSIEMQNSGKMDVSGRYNEELFIAYYEQLKKLAIKVGADPSSLFSLALNVPEVQVANGSEELDVEEWSKVLAAVNDTLAKCEQFRLAEGRALEQKLASYIEAIRVGLQAAEMLDPKRIERIRTKIKNSITDFFGNEGFDANRLEQEIIFYIEKLDIHEERVRLKTHLDYFLHILSEKQSNGKKLGFIAQEIGREINTIGSKANDADIQKHVVAMKEELEKIKEQL
ncbi:MAG: YicC/YloC family endoribonuclease, partial [Flammeovirgaceae bacterium]